MAKANEAPGPKLLRLRTIAAMIDTPAETLRGRVLRGTFPRPLSVVDRDWYYKASWVTHWIKTGEWPADVRFNGR